MKNNLISWLLVFGVWSGANAATLNYSDFSNLSDFRLVGSATQNGNRVRLTSQSELQRGALWLTNPISVIGDFSVDFSYYLHHNTSWVDGDGVTFTIQNEGTGALGGWGGSLGYADDGTNPSISDSVAFAFEYWQWDSLRVYENGSTTYDSYVTNFSQFDQWHNVSISYVAISHSVTILYDGAAVLSDFILPHSIDVSTGGNTAYVGFTASTGGAYSEMDVGSLKLSSSSSVPEPSSIVLLALGALGIVPRKRCQTRFLFQKQERA